MTAESVHNCIEKEIRDLSSCNCLKSGAVCLQRDCGSRPSGSTVKSASRVTSVATFSASAGAENSSCGLDTCTTRAHMQSRTYTGWQWRHFDSYLCQLVFAAILWVKLSEMFATVISLNTLRWLVNDHTDIFMNQRIEFRVNNTTNLRPFTPHINTLCHTIPTKWRSYRGHRFCDVTLPYV